MIKETRTPYRERWLAYLCGEGTLIVAGNILKAARACNELGWSTFVNRSGGVVESDITQKGRDVLALWRAPKVWPAPSLTETRAVAYLRRHGYTVTRADKPGK